MNAPTQAGVDELTRKPPSQISDREWQTLGFRNISAVKAGFAFLQLRPDIKNAIDGHQSTLIRGLSRSCDPDQSFSALQRWFEAGGASVSEQWSEPAFFDILCQLFAATPALSEYFIRFPARTAAVIRPVLLKQI